MRFLAPPHRVALVSRLSRPSRLSRLSHASRATWALASLSLLWPEAPRAQPVPATLDAARCPEKGGPQPTLKADYDRAQAAFQDVARMFPAAREPEAKAPLSANLAARDVHLRGDLARAQAQLDAAPPGSQAWLQADQEYTQARLREACGMPRAARLLYLNILWTPYALPGTVALAREGLARLGLPGLVAALPSEGPANKDDALKAYRAALSTGRAAVEKNKPAEARIAFLNAISHASQAGAHGGIDSSDWQAVAFSELGLAAYQLRDLDEAQHFTREAIRRELFLPAGRAAGSLYNLGLILEAKGDALGAITAYRASLSRRENATVRGRLAALLPGSDRPIVVPRAMLGPFPSLAAYCEKAAPTACLADSSPDAVTFGCQRRDPVAEVKAPQAPYTQVALFSTGCLFDPAQGRGTHAYRLLIGTARGVYVSPVVGERFENRRCESKATVRELALRDVVPGGAPEVVLRLQVDSSCVRGAGEGRDAASEFLLVAGLGAAGVPSSTESIPLALEIRPQGGSANAQRKEGRQRAQAGFLPDGTLKLEGDATSVPSALSGLLGAHRLLFP